MLRRLIMAEEPNRAEIQIRINDININVSGLSSQWNGKDLHTAAILGLIDTAHTDFWEKDVLQQGYDSNVTPADQFYASILSAIARHYAVNALLPNDMQVSSVLFNLIGSLVEKKRLSTIIRQGNWSEEDDEVYEES
jgi:hypothetical protein